MRRWKAGKKIKNTKNRCKFCQKMRHILKIGKITMEFLKGETLKIGNGILELFNAPLKKSSFWLLRCHNMTNYCCNWKKFDKDIEGNIGKQTWETANGKINFHFWRQSAKYMMAVKNNWTIRHINTAAVKMSKSW